MISDWAFHRHVVLLSGRRPVAPRSAALASSNSIHPETMIGVDSIGATVESSRSFAAPRQTVYVCVDDEASTALERLRRAGAPSVSASDSAAFLGRMIGRTLNEDERVVAGVVAAEALLAQGLEVVSAPEFREWAGIYTIGATPPGEVACTAPDQLEVIILLPGREEAQAEATLASASSRGHPDTAVFCALTGAGSVDTPEPFERPTAATRPRVTTADPIAAYGGPTPFSAVVVADAGAPVPLACVRTARPWVSLIDGALWCALVTGHRPVFLTASVREAEGTRHALASRRSLSGPANASPTVLSLGRSLSSVMRDPQAAQQALHELGRSALDSGAGDLLVLASPGLAPLVAPLREELAAPVVDATASSIALAEGLLALRRLGRVR